MLVATEQSMLAVAQRGGEIIRVASLLQFQPPAQFGNSSREIAYGKVCLLDLANQFPEALFGKVTHRLHGKQPSGKREDRFLRYEKIAHRMQFPYIKVSAQGILHTSLQQRGVRFEQILPVTILQFVCLDD